MALESCKVLIISEREYLAIRKGDLRCSGQSNWGRNPHYWKTVQVKPLNLSLTKDTVDLMPINLVMFNQTETEE